MGITQDYTPITCTNIREFVWKLLIKVVISLGILVHYLGNFSNSFSISLEEISKEMELVF